MLSIISDWTRNEQNTDLTQLIAGNELSWKRDPLKSFFVNPSVRHDMTTTVRLEGKVEERDSQSAQILCA